LAVEYLPLRFPPPGSAAMPPRSSSLPLQASHLALGLPGQPALDDLLLSELLGEDFSSAGVAQPGLCPPPEHSELAQAAAAAEWQRIQAGQESAEAEQFAQLLDQALLDQASDLAPDSVELGQAAEQAAQLLDQAWAPDSVELGQPGAAEDAAAAGGVDQLTHEMEQLASPSQLPLPPAPDQVSVSPTAPGPVGVCGAAGGRLNLALHEVCHVCCTSCRRFLM
jgi:hypothetical protein